MISLEASTTMPAIRILRLPDVCKITGLGRAMIYRLQASKRFPQSVKITDFAVGWVDAEVQLWLARRLAISRGEPAEDSRTGDRTLKEGSA